MMSQRFACFTTSMVRVTKRHESYINSLIILKTKSLYSSQNKLSRKKKKTSSSASQQSLSASDSLSMTAIAQSTRDVDIS